MVGSQEMLHTTWTLKGLEIQSYLVDLFPNASICENEACENVGTEDVPFCTKKGCPTTHPVLRMQQKDDMSPLYRLVVKVHYKQTGN